MILYSEVGRAGEIGKGTESFYHTMESPSLLLHRLLLRELQRPVFRLLLLKVQPRVVWPDITRELLLRI